MAWAADAHKARTLAAGTLQSCDVEVAGTHDQGYCARAASKASHVIKAMGTVTEDGASLPKSAHRKAAGPKVWDLGHILGIEPQKVSNHQRLLVHLGCAQVEALDAQTLGVLSRDGRVVSIRIHLGSLSGEGLRGGVNTGVDSPEQLKGDRTGASKYKLLNSFIHIFTHTYYIYIYIYIYIYMDIQMYVCM